MFGFDGHLIIFDAKVFYIVPKRHNQKSEEKQSALKPNQSMTITFVEETIHNQHIKEIIEPRESLYGHKHIYNIVSNQYLKGPS